MNIAEALPSHLDGIAVQASIATVRGLAVHVCGRLTQMAAVELVVPWDVQGHLVSVGNPTQSIDSIVVRAADGSGQHEHVAPGDRDLGRVSELVMRGMRGAERAAGPV